MLEKFDFDFEFCIRCDSMHASDVVDNGDDFDTVYNTCTLPDTTGTRRQVIFDKCTSLRKILKTSFNKSSSYASFINLGEHRYKVCIINTDC